MNHRVRIFEAIAIALGVLAVLVWALVRCGGPVPQPYGPTPAMPTSTSAYATPTGIRPTATRTPMPPTVTPTPVPMPSPPNFLSPTPRPTHQPTSAAPLTTDTPVPTGEGRG